MSSPHAAEARYQEALAYLKRVAPNVASEVQKKHKATDGGDISLGFGHGKWAGLSDVEREALRALLLCHVTLNPWPAIRKELGGIKQFFTKDKTHIDAAIRSFAALPVAGALRLQQAAMENYTQGSPGNTTWRGDANADLGTCWNFVASCAFQAGLLSLPKCLSTFFVVGSNGQTGCTRVLMNNTQVATTELNNVPPGWVVGFYRCPSVGVGGSITHVAISTGSGRCKGVRQPTNPQGVVEDKITAIVGAMKPGAKTEVIRVRICDPRGMEKR